jgi:signal transduction histidine kinase
VTKALKVPVSLITLIDHDNDRQFFKSQQGLPEPLATARQNPLSYSFCKYAVASGEPFIVEDARTNAIVRENLAVSELGVMAYLGVPLFDETGCAFGALCAADMRPRRWDRTDLEILKNIAAQAMKELSLRTALKQHRKDLKRVRERETRRIATIRADHHDLRTPLTSMLLGIQTCRMLGELSDSQSECLDIAEKAGYHLLTIVDQLLDISSIENSGAAALNLIEVQPEDVVTLAVEQVAMLAAEKSISIGRVVGAVPVIQADLDKLVRVLINLLGNAVKFTPEGGHVEIAVGAAEKPAFVQFFISDTGIGMDAAMLDSIFDDGFRGDKEAPTSRSTGIGLTFCKRIVEAHGGAISVESAAGAGSTFRIAIPISPN